MKFLSRLDPMTVLVVVVTLGVVITMSTQVVSQTSASEATAQAIPVDSASLASARSQLDES